MQRQCFTVLWAEAFNNAEKINVAYSSASCYFMIDLVFDKAEL